ncbi:hypothetical protein [Mesobacillus stamsii]|uniref:Uncharacterized protein n=1 Tax=Mesobacillus stamsii TaxID=225347 RepID=A0ABU0FVV2_9BACI|nr:hypothetical protein [Mesobacillus stamsii]MDQ0414050.1 hypothetical protein [Mesobacillus stamsii]
MIEDIEYANDIVKSANQKRPLFISFESEEKFRSGIFTKYPVELDVVLSALNDLKSHPRIEIKDKNSGDSLETRLEFFYNNELIMEGTISQFREIMTNPNNPNDKDPRLGLGDRFTLDEFPKEGDSTVVRVMKMTTKTNQLNGKPDTIQYYLEPYLS